MKITYQLRPEEIEEAWISAQWRVGIFQKWNQLLLTVIAWGLYLPMPGSLIDFT